MAKKNAKRKKHKKAQPVYEYFTIRIDAYHVSSSASIHHDVYAPQYAWRLDLDDPLYLYEIALTIAGTGIEPRAQEGHAFEIRLYGDDAPSRELDWKLSDVHDRDKHGASRYRSYRKRQIPVFREPKGMALLNKERGADRWDAWIPAKTRFVDHALRVLREKRMRYLSLHIVRETRNRWVRRVELQTTDPREE